MAVHRFIIASLLWDKGREHFQWDHDSWNTETHTSTILRYPPQFFLELIIASWADLECVRISNVKGPIDSLTLYQVNTTVANIHYNQIWFSDHAIQRAEPYDDALKQGFSVANCSGLIVSFDKTQMRFWWASLQQVNNPLTVASNVSRFTDSSLFECEATQVSNSFSRMIENGDMPRFSHYETVTVTGTVCKPIEFLQRITLLCYQ